MEQRNLTVYDYISHNPFGTDHIKLEDYFSNRLIAKTRKGSEPYLNCRVYQWHLIIELLGTSHKNMAVPVLVLEIDGDEARKAKMEAAKK